MRSCAMALTSPSCRRTIRLKVLHPPANATIRCRLVEVRVVEKFDQQRPIRVGRAIDFNLPAVYCHGIPESRLGRLEAR